MQYETIHASYLIQFHRMLRDRNMLLIRARPFTDSRGEEMYAMMYMEPK